MMLAVWVRYYLLSIVWVCGREMLYMFMMKTISCMRLTSKLIHLLRFVTPLVIKKRTSTIFLPARKYSNHSPNSESRLSQFFPPLPFLLSLARNSISNKRTKSVEEGGEATSFSDSALFFILSPRIPLSPSLEDLLVSQRPRGWIFFRQGEKVRDVITLWGNVTKDNRGWCHKGEN